MTDFVCDVCRDNVARAGETDAESIGAFCEGCGEVTDHIREDLLENE